METVYTLKEVAHILKISVNEVRKLISLNQLPCFEIGERDSKRKVKRVLETDLQDYIRDCMMFRKEE